MFVIDGQIYEIPDALKTETGEFAFVRGEIRKVNGKACYERVELPQGTILENVPVGTFKAHNYC